MTATDDKIFNKNMRLHRPLCSNRVEIAIDWRSAAQPDPTQTRPAPSPVRRRAARTAKGAAAGRYHAQFQAWRGPRARLENRMQCKVRWTGGAGMSFLAETGSGHAVVMDGAPEGGGNNLAPRPMEMVLLGTGGCTAYDVVLILRKSGQEISGCEVRLESERAEADPKVFTKIHLHFLVSGTGLKPNLVE